MQIIHSVSEIQNTVNQLKASGKRVGFVPTMGALHAGHISLVTASNNQNDVTIVSIFVNPTQFNDKNDLKNYPRTFETDVEMLTKAGAQIVFAPTETEMYPKPDTRIFSFGNLDNVMEGAHRPGHFNGVAQIVSKLFDAVPCHNAYFGDKDFQQLAIIKQLVIQLAIPIRIVPCPIIRESDGLAMSSRNTLLSPIQRANAPLISQTLFESKKKASQLSILELKEWVITTINKNAELEVEYFEISDDTFLKPVADWNEKCEKIGCIAVKVGKIRLIDNIRYETVE